MSINNYQSAFIPNTLLASIMLITQTNNFYMYTITQCNVAMTAGSATLHARCEGRAAARTSSVTNLRKDLKMCFNCQ